MPARLGVSQPDDTEQNSSFLFPFLTRTPAAHQQIPQPVRQRGRPPGSVQKKNSTLERGGDGWPGLPSLFPTIAHEEESLKVKAN